MEELTKCPDGKMRECGSDGKEHAVLVTSEICSVCVPLKEKIKELEGVKCKTPEDHAEEKATIEQLRVTVEEEYGQKLMFKKALMHLINKHGLDSRGHTPDYILADLMFSAYESFVLASECKALHENPEEKVLQQLSCGHQNFLKFGDAKHKCTICGEGVVKL